MTVEVKILGKGCPRCERLEERAREVAEELGIEANFEHVRDVKAIMGYEVVNTPALVVNEEVKATGRIPPKDEIAAWLREAQG